MRIKTRDFGTMDIDEREIIRFPRGVYAFESATEFVLIPGEGSPALYLQNVSDESPRFVVFHAGDVVDGYEPSVSDETARALEADSPGDLSLLVIAVVPENIRDMTVNLKSPIVCNRKKRLAMQVILEDGMFPIRYRLFD